MSQSTLDAISPEALAAFHERQLAGDRTVVVGINVNHDELVDMARVALARIPTNSPPTRKSRYIGGELRAHEPGQAFVGVAVKGVSWNDHDVVPSAVLQTLLGGGGSFSSGGPGKGMYTRVYRNILVRHPWVQEATCINPVYEDNGLFGILASGESQRMGDLARIVAQEMASMGRNLSVEEVERAKNQTLSNLIISLESRPVQCEDMARQLLCMNKYLKPGDLMDMVKRVTKKDLESVAQRLLSSPLTVVMHGELFDAPSLAELQSIVDS